MMKCKKQNKTKNKKNLKLLPNQEKMPQRSLESFLEDPGGLLIKPHRGYFVIFVDLDYLYELAIEYAV